MFESMKYSTTCRTQAQAEKAATLIFLLKYFFVVFLFVPKSVVNSVMQLFWGKRFNVWVKLMKLQARGVSALTHHCLSVPAPEEKVALWRHLLDILQSYTCYSMFLLDLQII